MIPITAWLLTIAALTFQRAELLQPGSWLRWLALLSLALLLPLLFGRARERLFSVTGRLRGSALVTLSAVAVAIAAAGGGTASFALLAIALPIVLAYSWFGVERTIAVSVLLYGAVGALDYFLLGRSIDTVEALVSAGALALITCALLGFGGQRDTAPSAVQDPDSASLEVNLKREAIGEESDADQLTIDLAPVSPLLVESDDPETVQSQMTMLSRGAIDPSLLASRPASGARQWWRSGEENRVIADYLIDARASTGADEAVAWTLGVNDNLLRPLAASSSHDWSEGNNADARWTALVQWSCEAAVIQCGTLEGAGGFAIAPLQQDGRLLGVLCLRRLAGFSEDTETVKQRAMHHAGLLARMVAHVESRRAAEKRIEGLDHALNAVRDMQESSVLDAPAAAISDAILHVCDCDASAVVRWDVDGSSGVVESGAGILERMERSVVASASLVGSVCERGTMLVVESAEGLTERLPLLLPGEQIVRPGAICIKPLRRPSGIVGALVASWNRPIVITPEVTSSLDVLAAVAAHSLDTAWKIEGVELSARTDSLTGLSNRRSLDEQLERILSESSRYGDAASLILVDLDYFKSINDKHGHAVGDLVLKHVAATLREGVRGVDLCARYGGEEMAILLPRTGLKGATETAERLRAMLESRPFALRGKSISVTASFGVASFPSPAPTPTALLSSADSALYRAKEAGRNRVRSARPSF